MTENIALVTLRREREAAQKQLAAAEAVHSAIVRKANLDIEEASTVATIYRDAVEEYDAAIATLERRKPNITVNVVNAMQVPGPPTPPPPPPGRPVG